MRLYKLVWEDRNGGTTEWLGTKADMVARRAEVRKRATKRPYDQIDIVFSRQVEVPTSKPELLNWLNQRHTKE